MEEVLEIGRLVPDYKFLNCSRVVKAPKRSLSENVLNIIRFGVLL